MKNLYLIASVLVFSSCAVSLGRVVTDVSVQGNTLSVETCTLRRVDIINQHSKDDCETKEFKIEAKK